MSALDFAAPVTSSVAEPAIVGENQQLSLVDHPSSSATQVTKFADSMPVPKRLRPNTKRPWKKMPTFELTSEEHLSFTENRNNSSEAEKKKRSNEDDTRSDSAVGNEETTQQQRDMKEEKTHKDDSKSNKAIIKKHLESTSNNKNTNKMKSANTSDVADKGENEDCLNCGRWFQTWQKMGSVY